MEQYIPKSALVAEIKKLHGNPFYRMAIKDALSIIDTLKVKEVDLDYIRKELDELIRFNKPDGDFGWGTLYNVATHFFELGLTASNPLTWEDMKLIWNITDEMDNMPEEEFYKEVLKRFKAQKGE